MQNDKLDQATARAVRILDKLALLLIIITPLYLIFQFTR